MAKQNFKVQPIEGKPTCAYVYINDRLSKVKAYSVSHSAGKMPEINVTLALSEEIETNGKIHIENLEEIANALNRDELSRLCDIWQELNNEHGRDC